MCEKEPSLLTLIPESVALACSFPSRPQTDVTSASKNILRRPSISTYANAPCEVLPL